MIQSKKDYVVYYQTDLLRTGLPAKPTVLMRFRDRRYRFYKSLRRSEYYTNCRTDIFGRLLGKWFRFTHHSLCDKYGWTIPENVFGPGLAIVHVGTIVVSGNARIGANCRLHVCVNIGSAWAKGEAGAPVIGDNCYIAPGAKLFGPITLGDNVAVGLQPYTKPTI